MAGAAGCFLIDQPGGRADRVMVISLVARPASLVLLGFKTALTFGTFSTTVLHDGGANRGAAGRGDTRRPEV